MNIEKFHRTKLAKNLSVCFFTTLAFLTFSISAFAQSTNNGAVQNPIGLKSLADLVNNLTIFIIPTAIVGFVFCVLYAGYTRLFAAGESAQEKKSISIAKSAAIGFAVIFLASVALLLTANVFKLNV